MSQDKRESTRPGAEMPSEADTRQADQQEGGPEEGQAGSPLEMATGQASQTPTEDAERDLQQDFVQLRQQLLRTQADLDNFRKRSRRELEDERKYATLPLIRDLVAVLDNLERAIDAAGTDKPGAESSSESDQSMT